MATKEKYSHVTEMKKMEKQWQRLYMPTAVVMDENDHIADKANFGFAQKKINTAPVQFYKLKNTGHLITYERPEFISDLLFKSVK